MLKAGDRIPDFDLTTDRGDRVSPKTLNGARTVLFFYPKDDTPTCTTEVCAFRDAMPQFDVQGARVYGISADDEKRHGRFASKFGLNYPLIADPEHQAIKGFGVWIEKQLYGRKYMGIARSTFVIDANGRIEQVWDKVKAETHAGEVAAFLRGEPAPAAKASSPPKAAPKKIAAKPVSAKPVATKKVAAKKVATKKVAAATKPAARKIPAKKVAVGPKRATKQAVAKPRPR